MPGSQSEAGPAFRPCTSPASYTQLEDGAWQFFVRAVGEGIADSSSFVKVGQKIFFGLLVLCVMWLPSASGLCIHDQERHGSSLCGLWERALPTPPPSSRWGGILLGLLVLFVIWWPPPSASGLCAHDQERHGSGLCGLWARAMPTHPPGSGWDAVQRAVVSSPSGALVLGLSRGPCGWGLQDAWRPRGLVSAQPARETETGTRPGQRLICGILGSLLHT